MQITTNTSQFFEGCGREGPIRCIFLSEFHPSQGPKITCQVGDNIKNVATIFTTKFVVGTRRLCF